MSWPYFRLPSFQGNYSFRYIARRVLTGIIYNELTHSTRVQIKSKRPKKIVGIRKSYSAGTKSNGGVRGSGATKWR